MVGVAIKVVSNRCTVGLQNLTQQRNSISLLIHKLPNAPMSTHCKYTKEVKRETTNRWSVLFKQQDGACKEKQDGCELLFCAWSACLRSKIYAGTIALSNICLCTTLKLVDKQSTSFFLQINTISCQNRSRNLISHYTQNTIVTNKLLLTIYIQHIYSLAKHVTERYATAASTALYPRLSPSPSHTHLTYRNVYVYV